MDVKQQIVHVRQADAIEDGPKRVLVIGSSGGYGLASRISAAFGCGAATIGVFFERPAVKNRTASPGWYKSAAFTRQAAEVGLYATNLNGDAFSAELKQATIDVIKQDLGQVDMVVYSLAAPARQLPDGSLVRSTLKPIGEPFEGSTIDLNSGELRSVSLEPASQEEVNDTVKVMGGQDWELWMAALLEAGVLAPGCLTTNYTYLGSEVTWPIYYHGTIGKAKEDLDRAAKALQAPMATVNGQAYVAVMKGVMTQAASAIPGMSVYLSLLFKVMKAKETHEGCIEQTTRLFKNLFVDAALQMDQEGRLRMDDWELMEDVQAFVKQNWSKVSADNLMDITDFAGYRQAYLQMHGFDFDGVDYDAEVEPGVPMTLAYGS
ncbi:MAG: enoyl-[acyl-carrier protein] reductase/trans-2-enoyl-CoA reductase (NAD+) [Candidatus Azotimanducaceae bacterium]|jgi:enoyl-[acyl-carrier protein] reductase/trans-2-enoyl-CoA reductase (NAD+)